MGEVEPTFTADDALGAMKFGKFQYLCFAFAGMGWASQGMEMMLMSFLEPAVKNFWDLSAQEASLLRVVAFAGMLVGFGSWGIISDKYGRRKGFLITATMTFLAGFASAFAPNYISLLVFRFLVGLGSGGGPVLFSWFLEFIPVRQRGVWMVIFSAIWAVGTILEAALAWIVTPTIGWRGLLGLSSVPSFLILIFYTSMPESPRYLCAQGRKAEALAILESVANVNESRLPQGKFVTKHELDLHDKILPPVDLKPFRDPTASVRAESSILTLFSPQLLKITLRIWLVFYGSASMYYGIVLLTTKLNSNEGHCSKDKKRSALESGKQDSREVNYKDAFITSFADFLGLFISAVLIDYVGRKFSMTSMFSLCSIFLVPLVFNVPREITIGLLLSARSCIKATFTIVFIYASEAYPTSVRSTGLGLSVVMAKLGGIVTPSIAAGIINGCNKIIDILVYAAVSFLAGVCVLYFPFDTNGRELDDSVITTRPNTRKGATQSRRNGATAESSNQDATTNVSSSRQYVTLEELLYHQKSLEWLV